MTSNKKIEYLSKRKKTSLGRITECLNSDIEIDIKYVIYFMNSLRNILEICPKKARYTDYLILNFFTNWCLHSEISKSDYENIVSEPEKEFMGSNEIRIRKGIAPLDKSEMKYEYINFISQELMHMEKLREQIIAILKENCLPTVLVEKDNQWWPKFRKKLIETLESSPYTINKGSSSLEMLAMVNDSSMEESSPETYVGTVDVLFSDGEIIDINVFDGTKKLKI